MDYTRRRVVVRIGRKACLTLVDEALASMDGWNSLTARLDNRYFTG